MKNIGFAAAAVILMSACSEGGNPGGPGGGDSYYRQEMRQFVVNLSAWAKGSVQGFAVVPQNGQELVTDTGESDGTLQSAYISAIDATGREDMFYGYEDDDQPTPAAETSHLLSLCILCEEHGVEVLATDYCSTHSNMDDSYLQNAQNGFISFAADQRELNNIPDYPSEPWNVNSSDVFEIPLAKNFLYLLNGENYSTKQEFISAVCSTDYDAVIMDLFYEGEQFTREELEQMRFKNNGGRRILICYMSIGEAEDYRYYWQPEWNTHKPSWLGEENPFWPGNYKVDYWNPEWQAIIFGNENSYLQKIIDTGFDGVYLDIIDAFEFFENTRGARQG